MDFDDMMNDGVAGRELGTAIEFRPTLVIGLGGTGHEVLVRLKARFTETFGSDIFKIVKLLAFDTADETKTITNNLGQPVSLTKETELVNIGHVPVSSLLHNLDIHPTIRAWLPDNMPVRSITAGAQAVRPLGRLALFYHFNHEADVKNRLLGMIQELGNIKLRGTVGEGAVIARSRGINVFIVCSVCGGTGSGTFLDAAYLVKQLIEFSGIRQEFCFVNGILVLPQAFANVASNEILANSYAALRELEYFSKEGHYFARYPDRTEVRIHNRPFNICYLVDAVNERGKLLTGLEELAPMITESIFIQIGSQVGRATESVFDNVKSLTQMARDQMGEELPTAFSSLGTASLVFPAHQIINMCAYRFGQEFVSEGLLRQPDAEQAQGHARQFIGQSQLIPKQMIPELARDKRGQIAAVSLSKAWFEDIPDEQLAAEIKRILAQYENRKLNTEHKNALSVNVEKLQTQISDALRGEAVRLIDNPDYGPEYALLFLQALSRQLDGLVGGFADQRKRTNELLRKSQKERDALYQALADAVGSFFIGRHGRVVRARDEYLEKMEAQYQREFDIQRFNAAMTLLTNLKATVEEQIKEVKGLIDKLDQVHERFERSAREMMDTFDKAAFPLSTYITDEADARQYYEQYRRTVDEEVVRFLDSCSLSDQRDRQPGEIAKEVFEFVRETFAPIEEYEVEQIIEQKRRLRAPEKRLEDLREDSLPFWNYDAARLQEGGSLESIRVIGVEDSSHSIYTDKIRRRETLSSTHDPHQVIMFHTRHGLPIFALRQVGEYRRRYDEHRERQISPLHLYPNLPWLQDVEAGKQKFALGQAFDLIFKTGVWYYCRPRDPMYDDIRLGQGLDTAVTQFLSDNQLLNDVSAMVEEEIRRIGNEEAAKTIYEYVRQPRSSGPRGETELELQESARAFLEEMDYTVERVSSIMTKQEADRADYAAGFREREEE